MTEEEWLTATDSEEAIGFLRDKVSDRKLRLFGVECCRRCEILSKHTGSCKRLEIIERYAEGLATDTMLRVTGDAAWDLAGDYTSVGPDSPEGGSPEWNEQMNKGRAFETVAYLAMHSNWEVPITVLVVRAIIRIESFVNFEYQLRSLLHDIVGNPFRPVAFDPAWRTDTAVALARQMYESRDFGAMPILADALQDAGCESEEVLNHCRDANQPHVRGCWVVDCVLGKE